MDTSTLAILYIAVSQSLGLPPGLLSAVCFVESNHKPTAIHHNDGNGDSIGLCQVKKTTCAYVGIKGDLKDPTVNAVCAAKYLNYQYKRYGDWARAVTAYNKGSSDSHGGSAYLAKVMNAWAENK